MYSRTRCAAGALREGFPDLVQHDARVVEVHLSALDCAKAADATEGADGDEVRSDLGVVVVGEAQGGPPSVGGWSWGIRTSRYGGHGGTHKGCDYRR
jgi:hypothetical protein